jgi:uncharacterized protein (TIGR02147 family)
LVALPEFRDDPKWIANALQPQISVTQARAALATLSELGLLVRDEHGDLRQADPPVTTGSGPHGHHVVNFHRAMIAQALRALEEVPRDQRDISCVTLAVAEGALSQLKQRIATFRAEVLQMADAFGPAERVIQLNIQLFPLSVKKGGSK